MTADVGSGLDVTADLQLDVDGVQVQVSGAGQQLTVTVDDLPGLIDRVSKLTGPPGSSRHHLAVVADSLAAAGLTVTVSGQDGPVLDLGAQADSRVASALIGSRHFGVRSIRGVARVTAASGALRRPLLVAGAAVTVAVVVWWRALARRGETPS